MKVLLANPRGFCAGVDRAIDIVEQSLTLYGKPIYVRHEVVHNKLVVSKLKEKGAIFVEELDEVPDGQTVIFSAHGVSKSVRNNAERLNLKTIDATCPLVTKVHLEAIKLNKNGYEIIMIGHKGHPEVEGTMGQVSERMYLVENVNDVETVQVINPDMLAFVTQTTLSLDDTSEIVDALKKRFPSIHGPKKQDICYATQNRQDAVNNLAPKCDLFLVVGSKNSSNTNRLREVAEKFNIPAYRIDNQGELDLNWFTNIETIGITAGASAPEILVQEVVEKIKKHFPGVEVGEANGVSEDVFFPRPKELRSVE
ncbi:MAG: 4-hydroxy-3-methylbut-2-enyl diphosphate reductase [Calditrichaeota bacterium]|nr:4-hydroxy-3-methylbut-2-enyl diphosphate reductase [Calditrichota bacterium]